jgi:serine/threonine-protein kinase
MSGAISDENDPLIGRVIAGKMRVDELLGKGGMGRVYRATHTALKKSVAVKVLLPGEDRDPTRVTRFRREALAASRLDHPHSVQILDFGEDGEDGLLYLAMEYLEGEDLGSVLRRGPITLERTRAIMLQVLGALAAAHDRDVVHRDLKPGNIMVLAKADDEGHLIDHAKVCDFGLAKVMAPEAGSIAAPLTRLGTALGTPSYMSPEQAQGDPVDAKTDVYSCGAILYRMVTGALPFPTDPDRPWEVLAKHVFEEPRPISELVPGIDPRIEELIASAMAKDPKARPTARELRKRLESLRGLSSPRAVEPRVFTFDLPLASGRPRTRVLKDEERATPSAIAPTAIRAEEGPTLEDSPPPVKRGPSRVTPPLPPPSAPSPQAAGSSAWLGWLAVVVLIAGGGAFALSSRGSINELSALITQGDYAYAESYFLFEGWSELRDHPQAVLHMKAALRDRRARDTTVQRFNPDYPLKSSVWEGMEQSLGTGNSHPFRLELRDVREATFEGSLLWIATGHRFEIRGIYEGNYLLFVETKLVEGPQDSLTFPEKKRVYISNDEMSGIDGPYRLPFSARPAAL